MCSIIGVGKRLHKVLEQIDLGTLDSGERLLPFGLLINQDKTKIEQLFAPTESQVNIYFQV